jgi:hypothetical protein
MFRKLLPVILMLASPTWAATTFQTYSTPGDLQAVAGLTFTSLNLGSFSPALPVDASSIGIVSFSSPSNLTTAANPGGGWASGVVLTRSSGSYIDITFASDVVAFGAYYGELGASVLDVTLSGTAGGTPFSYTLSPTDSASPVYRGIVASAPFTSIRFATNFSFEQLAMNGISYGVANGAPPPGEAVESSTMALMGGSLVGLVFMARRKKRGQNLLPAAAQ